MQSLAYIPGSNGAANPSLMTVQTVRAPGATTITTNTVAGAPTKFYATMGAPHTFTDPVTGETITVISEATAVDFAGTINAGKVDIVAIAPGYADTRGSLVGDIIVIRPVTEWANNLFNVLGVSHNDDGTIKNDAISSAAMFADPVDPVLRGSEFMANFVASGGAVVATTGLVASISNIVYYIAGARYTLSSIANKTFTANKDTYIDITTAGVLTYVEVANGATTGMTPTANSTRIAKVVTNGTTVTSITQKGRDPLGNNIYWRLVTPGSIGEVWVPSVLTTATGSAFIDASDGLGPVIPVMVGQSGMIKVTVHCNFNSNASAGFQGMSFRLSGANTLAADDARAIFSVNTGGHWGSTFLVDGLTPGLTFLTAQYKDNVAMNFASRRLMVEAV